MSNSQKKPGVRERELVLREASSRRRDQLCALPFFFLDKITSWPMAIVALGYFFFVLGGEHFAGKDTSLAVRALINLGESDLLKWSVIIILGLGHLVWFHTFRQYVKRKGQREKELEQLIDLSRTSSGLAVDGQPKRIGPTQ